MLVAYQSLMASFLEPVSSLVNFGSTLGTYEQLWEEGGNYARLNSHGRIILYKKLNQSES